MNDPQACIDRYMMRSRHEEGYHAIIDIGQTGAPVVVWATDVETGVRVMRLMNLDYARSQEAREGRVILAQVPDTAIADTEPSKTEDPLIKLVTFGRGSRYNLKFRTHPDGTQPFKEGYLIDTAYQTSYGPVVERRIAVFSDPEVAQHVLGFLNGLQDKRNRKKATPEQTAAVAVDRLNAEARAAMSPDSYQPSPQEDAGPKRENPVPRRTPRGAIFEAAGTHRKLTYDTSRCPETQRTYIFPGGNTITIENVIQSSASRHGNHQLETADGANHVIPWGWICLTFPAAAKVTPTEVMERGS